MSEWAMGTISALPDAAMQDLFCAQHIDVKQSCRECWGRYLCGGGCYAHAAMSNGRIDQPDPQDCALTRHLMQLAVIVVGRLQRDHSDVLPELFSELVKAVPPKHRKFVPPLLRQYLPGAEAGDAAGCAAE
jgi:sulfatase maturation enzyme AslB (radical SAM superfamily)